MLAGYRKFNWVIDLGGSCYTTTAQRVLFNPFLWRTSFSFESTFSCLVPKFKMKKKDFFQGNVTCPVFLFGGLHFRLPGCHRQPRAGEGSRAAISVVKLKKSWSRIQLFPFLCQTFCFPGFKMSSLRPKSCHRSRFRVTSWKLIPGFLLANNVFFFWNWLMRTWR